MAKQTITPARTLAEVLQRIESHSGPPEEFVLAIADTLLDPAGFFMAIVTDRIWAKGWDSDGFEQRSGYRLYRHKALDLE